MHGGIHRERGDHRAGASNKRIDRVEASIHKVNTALEMLTGSLHDIVKRLSIMEDRVGR
jgi:hypothetical protein